MTRHQVTKRIRLASLFSVAFFLALMSAAPMARADGGILVLKADQLHVGNGEVVENGMVVIVDGVIRAVGEDLRIPQGAETIEIENGALTPGLIDAHAAVESTNIMTDGDRSASDVLHDIFCPRHKHMLKMNCCGSSCPNYMQHVTGGFCDICGFPDASPGDSAVGTRTYNTGVEQSSEAVPHTHIIDGLNLRSPDFRRLLADGVTTVYASPDSAAVIGPRGAIVRTGGPVKGRVLRDAAAVKAAMGTDPYMRGRGNRRPFRRNVNFHARRPTTRMGVTWVFRKAFHDAQRYEKGLPVSGADTPSEPALAALVDVLHGRIPLRIQARKHHDILSAIRLAKEFELDFTLEEATEAYKCVDEIKSAEVPVVFGPIYVTPSGYRASSFEVDQSRLGTVKALFDAGIETALTANDLRDEDGLSRQAMYAMRCGLTREQATKAVTQTPATMLGIDDELGTLEIGKRGDVVLWNNEPFEANAKPVVVVIDGEVVLDRRQG